MNGIQLRLAAPPLELEFDLLLIAFPFVFNREGGFRWNMDLFAADLDFERFPLFQAVGQPAQLGRHLFGRVAFFDIPVFFFSHIASLAIPFLPA
jgi:hypothetical protein